MQVATDYRFLQQVLSSLSPAWFEKHNDEPSTPASSGDLDNSGGNVQNHARITLTSLPPELHHMIASHLTYPDLLSLKLTDKYFSHLVTPKLHVRTRVRWVQSRHAQCLPVPMSTKLSFISDAMFVANDEVKTILRRRRQHLECLDYDWDGDGHGQTAFKNPVIALEVDGSGAMQHVQVRRRIRPSWSKACLVTGAEVCPRVREMELAKKRYDRSFMGKVCSNGRKLAWCARVAWWWLEGWWQTYIESLRRRRRET
ncbi:hypothetical protein A1O7_07951 [Cladophialophora yegresii CBS 114405]|uniref:F-box domain-containing protein n=1 Tax=Cladophialophora yegresii CBS 114405 TaxID=1182544 RepID=W9VPY2_9EURO|nr:uncharacterized protein A1O7_07951 [Cladophialophora yegresii CBS 114405]EXJ57603.1 hypothetical protein A1O7_07951 [Cladophialophora yegresii CBS 114405]